MVGGDGIHIAPLYSLPQGIQTLLALHRRRADEIPAVFPLEDIPGEVQVVGAGLHIDFQTLVLGRRDGFHTLLVGHMYDVKRGVQAPGPGNGSPVCLSGYKLRPGGIVIPGAELALRGKLFREGGEDLFVFRMDADQRAGLLGLLQDLIEIAVLHAKVIDHIYFKRGDAVVHGLLHGIE